MSSRMSLFAGDLVRSVPSPPSARTFGRAIITLSTLAIVAPTDALTAQADPARLLPGQTLRDCASCPEMVVVPAGTFIMGSPESEAGRLRVVYDQEGEAIDWTTQDTVRLEVEADQRLVIVEGPQRYVTIAAPFAVGVYEVTFDEWDACARGGGCGGLIPDHEGWGRGRRPVINVSWSEARSYAEWLSRTTGETYRLPSEAEWEYVARAGTETARYWGETDAAQCRHANGADATALREYPNWITVSCSDEYPGTAPVGSFAPNAFGLYDALGNVWEWTLDCWNERYSGAPADGSAWESGDCSDRVSRGGGWLNGPGRLRSASRSRDPVDSFRSNAGGFRVVRIIN